MSFTTKRAQRKPIIVEYVRVTSQNMEELAEWSGGTIRKTKSKARYIHVDVLDPKEPKQTRAFAGDYLLKSPNGFKIYTRSAFEKMFEDVPE